MTRAIATLIVPPPIHISRRGDLGTQTSSLWLTTPADVVFTDQPDP